MDFFEAADGEETLLETSSPDMIFVDLKLPGENGLEITKRIKAQHPEVTVILMTNYDLPEYREAAFQCRADHFLTKDYFLKMIESILPDQKMDQGDSDGQLSH
jgi:DNA-binding NarL/FixJ family response regulator